MRVDEGDLLIGISDSIIRRGVGSAGEGDKCSCINPGPTTVSSYVRGIKVPYAYRDPAGLAGRDTQQQGCILLQDITAH
jgi:hypothetical protein